MDMKSQSGNASIETILIATVMVPLLGGLPILGKISDVNNSTAQSSRYIAWEQTIAGPSHKTSEQLQTEVNNRFFAKPDLLIRTGRGALSDDNYNNNMWTGSGYDDDEGEQVNRLISVGNGIHTTISNDTPDSIAGSLSSGISQVGNIFASISGGEWNIENEGLYTATVSVDIGSNRYLSAGTNCGNQESETVASCAVRKNAIFVDSWDARNADHAAERARTFVPAGALEGVGNTIATVVGFIPFFSDIRGLRSDSNGGFGYVNARVVPMDRYAED